MEDVDGWTTEFLLYDDEQQYGIISVDGASKEECIVKVGLYIIFSEGGTQ